MMFIGPFPPPVHGQALASLHLADGLAEQGVRLKRLNTSAGSRTGPLGQVVRIALHLRAALLILVGAGPVYISANSNSGMWLTALLAGAARLRRRPVSIHHHAYDHVRRRRRNMVVMAKLAGAQASHIVLGETMAADLRQYTPEVKSTFVLNNAGLVDPRLSKLPEKDVTDAVRVLGHLSNLNADKGLAEVLELALSLNRQGRRTKLIIGGPASDDWTRNALAAAKAELGDMLDYRGPLYGDNKRKFFQDIEVFVFPTKYRNEASPLVLLEAMSAGAPCLSVALGCISEDLGEKGGFAFLPDEPFVGAATKSLDHIYEHYSARSRAARERYVELLSEHRIQLSELAQRLRVGQSVLPMALDHKRVD